MERDSGPAARLHELPGELLALILRSRPPRARGTLTATREDVDWEALSRDVASHALVPLVWARLGDLGARAHLPPDVARRWELDARHARLQAAIQTRDAVQVSLALRRRGIRHAFFKGFGYGRWLYQPSWARVGADVDLLIERPAVEAARAAMRELGFVQASATLDYRDFRPATPEEIRSTEAAHHELGQFARAYRLTDAPPWLFAPEWVRRPPYTFEKRGGDVYANVVFDVHWALHFLFEHERPLEGARTVEVPGGRVPVLGTAWSILASAFKLYFEAFDRPYYGFHHLADLAALLGEQPAPEEWETVAATAGRHDLQPALFYTLSAAERILGRPAIPGPLRREWSVTAPDPATLKDGTEKRTYRAPLDFGDFLPYMTGRRVPGRLGELRGGERAPLGPAPRADRETSRSPAPPPHVGAPPVRVARVLLHREDP